jgi:hypothetical protein
MEVAMKDGTPQRMDRLETGQFDNYFEEAHVVYSCNIESCIIERTKCRGHREIPLHLELRTLFVPAKPDPHMLGHTLSKPAVSVRVK